MTLSTNLSPLFKVIQSTNFPSVSKKIEGTKIFEVKGYVGSKFQD
jgi:hypothetical protein